MPDSTAPQSTSEYLTSSFHTVCLNFATGGPRTSQSLLRHFNDFDNRFVLIDDHHTKQFERRGADDFAAVPKLSFDELGIARLHQMVGLVLYFCYPLSRKYEMKLVSMMEMARNHCTGWHVIDIRNHLFIGHTREVYLNERGKHAAAETLPLPLLC